MTRDEYVRKLHSRLDQWNGEITALAERAERIEKSALAEFGVRMEDLRNRRDAAKAQLQQLEQASEGAWQDLRAGLDQAWDAVAQALEAARSRYK